MCTNDPFCSSCLFLSLSVSLCLSLSLSLSVCVCHCLTPEAESPHGLYLNYYRGAAGRRGLTLSPPGLTLAPFGIVCYRLTTEAVSPLLRPVLPRTTLHRAQ